MGMTKVGPEGLSLSWVPGKGDAEFLLAATLGFLSSQRIHLPHLDPLFVVQIAWYCLTQSPG